MQDKTITITLPVGEMGAASIALDKFISSEYPKGGHSGAGYHDFEKAQKRFDEIYRSYWCLVENGVKTASS